MRRTGIICLLLSVAFCATIKSLNEDIAVLKKRSVVTNNNFLVEDKKHGSFEDKDIQAGRILKRAVSQTIRGSQEDRLPSKGLKDPIESSVPLQKGRSSTSLQTLQEEKCLSRQNAFGYTMNNNGQNIPQGKEETDLKEALQQKEIELAALHKKYETRIAELQEEYSQHTIALGKQLVLEKENSEKWQLSYKEMQKKMEETEDQLLGKLSQAIDYSITVQALLDKTMKELIDSRTDKNNYENKISSLHCLINFQKEKFKTIKNDLKNEIFLKEQEQQQTEIDYKREIDRLKKSIYILSMKAAHQSTDRERVLDEKNKLISNLEQGLKAADNRVKAHKWQIILVDQLISIAQLHSVIKRCKNKLLESEQVLIIKNFIQRKMEKLGVLKEDPVFFKTGGDFLKNKFFFEGLNLNFFCVYSWIVFLLKLKSKSMYGDVHDCEPI